MREHPHTHAVALQRELDSVKERYKKQVSDLHDEVTKVTAELSRAKRSNDCKLWIVWYMYILFMYDVFAIVSAEYVYKGIKINMRYCGYINFFSNYIIMNDKYF